MVLVLVVLVVVVVLPEDGVLSGRATTRNTRRMRKVGLSHLEMTAGESNCCGGGYTKTPKKLQLSFYQNKLFQKETTLYV